MAGAPSRKLAVILHADVVGSTGLVRRNETIAHERIRDAFRRLSVVIASFDGTPHEIRGDALVAEFSRVSDAVGAATTFQVANADRDGAPSWEIHPLVRVGIAMGEVVVADGTVTGEVVVMAQRLEQLAEPGGVCIQGAAYETIPKRLPFSYENLGELELKGFDEPVKAYSASLQPGSEVAGTRPLVQDSPQAPHPPDKPSIAVLPFTSLCGDPEQEYFAAGVVEDIITDLSRFKDLLVIAHNSSFSYKGKSVATRGVASELGVRFLVEGTVRKAGERVRISAQLIDAADGSHLWGERYDRELRDIFSVQDEIVETIVCTLVGRLERHGIERAGRTVAHNLKAYDYVLQAREVVCDSAASNRRCRELYEAALRFDPRNAAACCGISLTHGLDHTSGWSDSPEESLERAIAYALEAVALDDDSSEGHTRLGEQRLFNREYDLARYHLDKALALNPNDASAWAYKGVYYIYTGNPKEALSALEQATRRNPFHHTWYLWFVGLAHYCSRQYEQAIPPLQRAIDHEPSFIAPRRHLAACYAQLGRHEEAASQAAKILELDPEFSISGSSATLGYRDGDDLEHYLNGLRAAGLPD